MSSSEPPPGRTLRPSLGLACGALVAALAWYLGLRPLDDNSFFTHLATGRLILERGSVPSTDPYTFTALGEPWTVQSWLPSWAYATVEALGGGTGLRVLTGLLVASIAALGWALTARATSLLARLGLITLFLVASATMWSERPLLVGLIGIGLTALAEEGRLRPVWLLPFGWLWANSHGSFPLGLGLLVVAAAGRRLDGEDPGPALRSLSWLAGGAVCGAMGPLGLRALTFPVALLGRGDVLQHVQEWRSPAFDSLGQRSFLALLLLAALLLVRRPSWRSGLLLVVFGAAALVSVRNAPVAALALLGTMAPALPAVGSLRAADRGPLAPALLVTAVLLAVVLGTARLEEPDFDLSGYPVAELAHLRSHAVDTSAHLLAAPDVVGNLREVLDGPRGDVFADDRFDMFPADVLDDHLTLLDGRGVRSVLDDHSIELVVARSTAPPAQVLMADPDWRVLVRSDSWVLGCRRGVQVAPELHC